MGALRIGGFFRIGVLVALRELVVLGELVVFRENWLYKKLLENYIVASRNWFGELVESRNWSGELEEFQRIGRILEGYIGVTSRSWLGELVKNRVDPKLTRNLILRVGLSPYLSGFFGLG